GVGELDGDRGGEVAQRAQKIPRVRVGRAQQALQFAVVQVGQLAKALQFEVAFQGVPHGVGRAHLHGKRRRVGLGNDGSVGGVGRRVFLAATRQQAAPRQAQRGNKQQRR